MSELRAIVPVARVPIAIRVATMSDLPFIDRLQKMHSKMVGWMPTRQPRSEAIGRLTVRVLGERDDLGRLDPEHCRAAAV